MIQALSTYNDRQGGLYGCDTLEANWFEERCQETSGASSGERVPEGAKELRDSMATARYPDQVVTDRTKRWPQLDTWRIMANDGSKDYLTTNKLMIQGKQNLVMKPEKTPMITEATYNQSLRARPTQTPLEGPDAVLKRHPADLEERYLNTNYRDDYAPKQPDQVTPAGGFKYEKSIEYNPMPFPAENAAEKMNLQSGPVNEFAQHHKTSSIRMFNSFRASDASRLGLTSQLDDLGPGYFPFEAARPSMPLDAKRVCTFTAHQTGGMKKGGYNIWSG
jgi:hypothetical protein